MADKKAIPHYGPKTVHTQVYEMMEIQKIALRTILIPSTNVIGIEFWKTVQCYSAFCPAHTRHTSCRYLVEVTRRIPPLDRCHTWLCTVCQVPVRWFPSTCLCSASLIHYCPIDRSRRRPKTKASGAAACPVWTAADLDLRIHGRSRPCKRPPWLRTGPTRLSKSSWRRLVLLMIYKQSEYDKWVDSLSRKKKIRTMQAQERRRCLYGIWNSFIILYNIHVFVVRFERKMIYFYIVIHLLYDKGIIMNTNWKSCHNSFCCFPF